MSDVCAPEGRSVCTLEGEEYMCSRGAVHVSMCSNGIYASDNSFGLNVRLPGPNWNNIII